MEGFLISGKNGVFFNDSSVQDQWFMFWMRLINQWTLNTNGLVLVLIAVPKYICTCWMKYLMPPQSSTKRFFEWLQNSSVQLAEHSTYFSAYDSINSQSLQHFVPKTIDVLIRYLSEDLVYIVKEVWYTQNGFIKNGVNLSHFSSFIKFSSVFFS